MSKKNSAESLTVSHVVKSSIITVAVAEILPLIFGVLYFYWQNNRFGTSEQLMTLVEKGSYGWAEMQGMSFWGFGAGVIVTLGIIMSLATLIVDEWAFSHKISSLKNVAILSLAWGASFYVVDYIISNIINFPTGASVAPPASLITFMAVIMVTPVAVFYGRRFASK